MPYLQELMKNQYIMMQVQKLCLFFSSYGTNERKGFFINGKNKNNMIISYIKKSITAENLRSLNTDGKDNFLSKFFVNDYTYVVTNSFT